MAEPLPETFSYQTYNPKTIRLFKIFKNPIPIQALNAFDWVCCDSQLPNSHHDKGTYPFVTNCRYNREHLYPYILDHLIPNEETECFVKFWQDDIEYNKGDEDYDQESSNWWACFLLHKTTNTIDAAYNLQVKDIGGMRAYLFDWEMQLMLSCILPGIIFDSQGWMSAPQLVQA